MSAPREGASHGKWNAHVEFEKHNLKRYAYMSNLRKFRVIFHQRSLQDIFA